MAVRNTMDQATGAAADACGPAPVRFASELEAVLENITILEFEPARRARHVDGPTNGAFGWLARWLTAVFDALGERLQLLWINLVDHLAREKVERIEDRHATVRWLLYAKGELGAPEQEGVDAPLRGDAREHGVKRLVRLLRHARDRLEPPARVVDRLVQPLLVVLSREDHREPRRREPCGQCTGLQGPVCAEQADAPGRSLA